MLLELSLSACGGSRIVRSSGPHDVMCVGGPEEMTPDECRRAFERRELQTRCPHDDMIFVEGYCYHLNPWWYRPES